MINLPNYSLTELIHQGKNNLVFKGFQKVSLQKVIIKLLHIDYPTSNQLAEFMREYEFTSQLWKVLPSKVSHPIELVKHQNTLAIVLEDAGDLSLELHLAKKSLPIRNFLKIAIQITEILESIHAQHVVHKDLNPSNILIHPQTLQVRIIDFGISTTLSFENLLPNSISTLEGTLSYISPEQTGRINRSVDYRSDYYSLGMTFFEMLTSSLPFQQLTPLELVHAHIAKIPIPPHDINPAVPPILSAIVIKLLSKTPEQRYQSTFGLLQDLKKCLNFYETSQQIPFFDIAEIDVSAHFQIPEKLYGRSEQQKQLLHAYHQAKEGPARLVFISGLAGVGKTSLVQDLNKLLTLDRGYFVSGKSHPMKKNIPYEPFLASIRMLLTQISNEPPNELKQWKHRLKSILGTNGRVISDLIPEIESLIGPQPEISELGLKESQRRFNYIFKTFIQTLASSNQPLVLFLDDLHWADLSTFQLIHDLLKDPKSRSFLIIGAYQPKEVEEFHPLRLLLADLASEGLSFENTHLDPLEIHDLTLMLEDTLHRPKELVLDLAVHLHKKTQGNPFFINQLLHSLYKEKLIYFDFQHGQWEWKLNDIQDRDFSENVINLMTEKISALSIATQNVLRLASCLGNHFELAPLAKLYGKSIEETSKDLWQALEEGIVIPERDNYRFISNEMDTQVPYRFLHDRIHQALSNQILPEQKENLHYQIGNILLRENSLHLDQNVFEISNHLNRGKKYVVHTQEKLQLARLNLAAAKKAKASSAFNVAVAYSKASYEILPENHWESAGALTYDLMMEWISYLYLTGGYDQAKIKIKEVLEHARTPLQKAEIYSRQAMLFSTISKMNEGVDIALEGLRILGVQFPKSPTLFSYLKEFAFTKWNLINQPTTKLLEAPEISDPSQKLVIELLHQAIIANYFSGSSLLTGLLVLKQINIILKHGNSKYSALAYINYAVMLNVLGQLNQALDFGKLALAVSQKFGDEQIKQNTFITYTHLIYSWNYPWKNLRERYRQAIDDGLHTGDLTNILIGNTYYPLSDPEMPLGEVVKEFPKHLEMIKIVQYQNASDVAHILFQTISNMCGQTEGLFSLSGPDFNEYAALERFESSHFISGYAVYALCKSLVSYHFEDFLAGINLLKLGDSHIESLYGSILYTEYCFYAFLLHAASYQELKWYEKIRSWRRMQREYRKFVKWSRHCPVNFMTQKLIMEAEIARLKNDEGKAIQLYDRAISQAQDVGFLKHLALANELAAKYCFTINKIKLAKLYLFDARYHYLKWGATSKVKQLEESYLKWIPMQSLAMEKIDEMSPSTYSQEETPSRILDFISIMKASQTMTRETNFASLIQKMMQIVVENAGAQQGHLIFEKEGDYFLEAFIANDKFELIPSLPVVNLPLSLIKSVAINKQPVILGNAAQEGIFQNDPYIRKNQTKSIFCCPLINQGVVKGMIYLENNLVHDVFIQKHLDVVTLLSNQIAISLDNARFYGALEQNIHEGTKALRETQQQLIQKEKMAYLGMLTTGIAHEIKNPLNFIINFAFLSSDLLKDLKNFTKEKKWDNLQQIESILANMNQQMELIHDQGKKADLIVNRLIEHSAEQSQAFVETDLHQLIDMTLNSFLHLKQKKGQDEQVEIIRKYHPFPMKLKLAEADFQRVIMNLLENAYKTLSEKKQQHADFHPQIVIETIDTMAGCEIHVRDNGLGIPSDLADKIFTPFFSLQKTRENLGLGLSLSYNIIVEEHGGQLSFSTKSGESTEFMIKLPYR